MRPAPGITAISALLLMLVAGCVYRDDFHREDPPITSDEMISSFVAGDAHAQGQILLHAEPEVGQYAEYTTSWGMVERWCVVREVNGHFIVENQRSMDSHDSRSPETRHWVMAFLVAPGEQKPDVLRAWVAVKNGEPTEIRVGPIPTPLKSVPIILEEEAISRQVNEYTLNGIHRRGQTEGQEGTTWEQWLADDAWFGGVVEVRTTYAENASSYRLDAMHLHGESWMNWDGVDVRPDHMLDAVGRVVPREQR